MRMTERQSQILRALVREHTRTTLPVGSGALVQRYRLPYSSATVRAELGDLEADGYLAHPHISAGRVPTSQGYRHYVNHDVRAPRVTAEDVSLFRDDLVRLEGECHRIARRAAKLIAHLTRHLAIAGIAEREELYEAGLADILAEPEFADTEGLREVSRVVDALDAQFEELVNTPINEPMVYIGEENPLTDTRRVSVLMITVDFPSGERGILAVVGPTRMRYDRNIQVLARVAKALETLEGGRR